MSSPALLFCTQIKNHFNLQIVLKENKNIQIVVQKLSERNKIVKNKRKYLKMHLNNITKGILPLIIIIGLFKLRGIDAVGNQKVSGESKQIETYDDYNEDVDVSNDEVLVPKSTIKPYFESNSITFYATKEIENITLECLPQNFNDSRHQILWYNDEHPITNGNTSLSIEKYAVDNKYRLTIFNYNKKTPGNFSCAVLPTDIRQYVVIEFGAPPENITHQHDASTVIIVEIGLILTSLMAILSSNY